MNRPHAQDGMTLIEVLVALLILSVGLLGAAAVQVRALQYTDGARMTSQASFIAYGMLDRIRAGSPQGPVAGPDLEEFTREVADFAGPDAKGSLDVGQGIYRVQVSWNDSRAAGQESRRTLQLGSRMAPGLRASP
ncbi:type IV pilus modification protein PilV [Pseudomonas sp. NFXW11]|uniref:type IV pilus modification protein PilV n=1 Tax=Pseudomonas sp. NFXW11 TaxID=2819531 RepID=UPI003CE8885F